MPPHTRRFPLVAGRGGRCVPVAGRWRAVPPKCAARGVTAVWRPFWWLCLWCRCLTRCGWVLVLAVIAFDVTSLFLGRGVAACRLVPLGAATVICRPFPARFGLPSGGVSNRPLVAPPTVLGYSRVVARFGQGSVLRPVSGCFAEFDVLDGVVARLWPLFGRRCGAAPGRRRWAPGRPGALSAVRLGAVWRGAPRCPPPPRPVPARPGPAPAGNTTPRPPRPAPRRARVITPHPPLAAHRFRWDVPDHARFSPPVHRRNPTKIQRSTGTNTPNCPLDRSQRRAPLFRGSAERQCNELPSLLSLSFCSVICVPRIIKSKI